MSGVDAGTAPRRWWRETGMGASILDLHVWRVGPAALAVIVDVAEPACAATIRERLKGLKGVAHLTVQTHSAPGTSPGRKAAATA